MKRLVMILLVVCLVLPLGACFDTGDTTTPAPPDEVPAVDLGGYEYRAFVQGHGGGGVDRSYRGFERFSEWDTDVISMAAYQRNRELELKYNCRIVQRESNRESMLEELTSLKDSDAKFECVILPLHESVAASTLGLLRDLKTIDEVDLSVSGFHQPSMEDISLGNRLYFVTGDMDISAMDNAMAVVYNRDLWEREQARVVETLGDEKFADLYSLVDAGEWTLDNLRKIAVATTQDADPDDGEALSYKTDTIGYFEYWGTPLNAYYAAGGRIGAKDAADYPTVTLGSTVSRDLYDALYDYLNLGINPSYIGGGAGDRSKAFQSGNVLLADYILWDARRVLALTKIDFEYGLLPIPALETGSATHTLSPYRGNSFGSFFWSIPVNCNDASAAAIMLNAMANSSQNTLTPTYDASILGKGASANDPSYGVLARMRETLTFDIPLLYAEGGYSRIHRGIAGITTSTERKYDTYVTPENEQDLKEFLDELFLPLKNQP